MTNSAATEKTSEGSRIAHSAGPSSRYISRDSQRKTGGITRLQRSGPTRSAKDVLQTLTSRYASSYQYEKQARYWRSRTARPKPQRITTAQGTHRFRRPRALRPQPSAGLSKTQPVAMRASFL